MAQDTFTGSNNQEFFTTIEDAIAKFRELDAVTQKSKDDIKDYAKSFNNLTKELKAFAKASVGNNNNRGSRKTRPSSYVDKALKEEEKARKKEEDLLKKNKKTAVDAFSNIFNAIAGNNRNISTYVNILTKGSKVAGTAAKGTEALGAALGVVSTTGAAVVGVLGLIVAALVAMTSAGKKAYERNMDLNRSLMQMGAGANEMKNASSDIANKAKEIENKWSLIGQKLSNIFQPVYEFFLDIADKFTDLIASITGANKVGLNNTNTGTRVSWYTGMLQSEYSEPETKSIPTINNIAGSARQSGFDLNSAVNLAIGTYDAAYKLGEKFGLQAQDIAKQLADAWLTGSDAAKDYGVVVNDTVLAGYMASKGVDIVNVQITDAMKQYYRYQLMLEETNAKSQDAIQDQVKAWTQLGMQIEATKQKLFSFDEVINLQGLDTTIPIVGEPDVGPYEGSIGGNSDDSIIPPIVIKPFDWGTPPDTKPFDWNKPDAADSAAAVKSAADSLADSAEAIKAAAKDIRDININVNWGDIPNIDINWGEIPNLDINWGDIPNLTINWGEGWEEVKKWGEQWVTQWNFGWDVGTILLAKWLESWKTGENFNTTLSAVLGQAKDWQKEGLTYYAAITASLAKIFETFNNIVTAVVNKFIEIKEKFTSVGEKIKSFGENLGIAFKYKDELQRATLSEATGGNLRIGDVLAKAVEESSKGQITKEEYIDAWNQSIATGKLGEIKQSIDKVGNWFESEAPINHQNIDKIGQSVGQACAMTLITLLTQNPTVASAFRSASAAGTAAEAASTAGTAGKVISAAGKFGDAAITMIGNVDKIAAAEIDIKVKNKKELDQLTVDLDTLDKKQTVTDVEADTKKATTNLNDVNNKLNVLSKPRVVTIAANDRISSVISSIQARLNSLMSYSYTPSYSTHNTASAINSNTRWLNNSTMLSQLAPMRHFAAGGIGTHEINNATLFEDNKKEAVIPLESQSGIDYLASAMREAQGGSLDGGSSVTINLSLNGIFDTDDRGKWEQLAEKLGETIQIQMHRRGDLAYGSSY